MYFIEHPRRGIFIALACGLAILGCGHETPDPTTLRWNPDIRPIFERACVPCHSRADSLKGPNAHGLNLERYEKIRGTRAKIHETVVVERSMPGPNDAGIRLSDEEIGKIGEWIRGGAPR
jgi:uncharacterized membrane protein